MMKVFHNDLAVGLIDMDPDVKGPRFTYDAGWLARGGAFPISTSMPLAADPYAPGIVFPWLANLLPEEGQLEGVAHALGAARTDIMGLLAHIGRETAGALSFQERGIAGRDWRLVAREADLERIIDDLPRKPFLAGEEGVSISLAGAQTKMAVALDDAGRIHVPVNGSASTHILKPDVPNRLIGSVASEALCAVLARRCGLNAAQVTTGRAGARDYLLVRRYDRELVGDLVLRRHQEDMCQALGYLPTQKYQHNQTGTPGPGIAMIVGALRRIAQPRAVLDFLDGVIFNILVGNPDAHGKNYSILIGQGRGTTALAPLYDMMCADPWGGVDQRLAMSVNGERRARYIEGKDWAAVARSCDLTAPMVINRVRARTQGVLDNVDAAVAEVAAMPGRTYDMLPIFREAIVDRTLRMQRAL